MLGWFFFRCSERNIYIKMPPQKVSPLQNPSTPKNRPFFRLNQGFGDVVSWRFCKIIMGDLDPMSGEFNWLGVGWVGWVGCWRVLMGRRNMDSSNSGTRYRWQKAQKNDVFVFFQEVGGLGWNPFWDVSIFVESPCLKDGWMTLQFNSEATHPTVWKISSNTHQVQSLLWLMFDSTEQCLEGVWMVGFEFCMVQLYQLPLD